MLGWLKRWWEGSAKKHGTQASPTFFTPDNEAGLPQYQKFRRQLREAVESCTKWHKITSEYTRIRSPSGNVELQIFQGNGGLSKVEVWRWKEDKEVQSGAWQHWRTLHRNYEWLDHDWLVVGGTEYLIFSEHYYGGYGILNLTTGVSEVYFSEKSPFCWRDMWVAPYGKHILVRGCYWGFPDELRVYRISDDPMVLPWRNLHIATEISRLGTRLEEATWVTEKEEGELVRLFPEIQSSLKLTVSLDPHCLDAEMQGKFSDHVRFTRRRDG